jgi:hypothetical protein
MKTVKINRGHLFLCPRIERSGSYSFLPVRLSVCKSFNIGHIFWMVSDNAFIFHMCVPYDKTFLLVLIFFYLLTLKFDPLFKNFNIGHIFWMANDKDFICVFLMTRPFYWSLTHFSKTFNIGHIFWMASDRAFIFHVCVPYDKNFLLVPKVFTLWPWPWSLTHFL